MTAAETQAAHFGAAGSKSRQTVGGPHPNRKPDLRGGHSEVMLLVWGQENQQGRRIFHDEIGHGADFFGHGFGCLRSQGGFRGPR